MKDFYVLAVKQGLMDSPLHYRLVSLSIYNYSKYCYRTSKNSIEIIHLHFKYSLFRCYFIWYTHDSTANDIYITFIFKNKAEPFEWRLDVPCVKTKCKVHQFKTSRRPGCGSGLSRGPRGSWSIFQKGSNISPLQMAECLARVGFWWELSQFFLFFLDWMNLSVAPQSEQASSALLTGCSERRALAGRHR